MDPGDLNQYVFFFWNASQGFVSILAQMLMEDPWGHQIKKMT